MRDIDLCSLLCKLRPEAQEYITQMYAPLLYQIEQKVTRELLHLEREIDLENLVLPPPFEEVYWTYILPFVDLGRGDVQMYREGRVLFSEAWENLRRSVFEQGENFKIAVKGRDDWWVEEWS